MDPPLIEEERKCYINIETFLKNYNNTAQLI